MPGSFLRWVRACPLLQPERGIAEQVAHAYAVGETA